MNEALSWIFLGHSYYKFNGSLQDKTTPKKTNQQGLTLSTEYFPSIIFVLTKNQLSVIEALEETIRSTVM